MKNKETVYINYSKIFLVGIFVVMCFQNFCSQKYFAFRFTNSDGLPSNDTFDIVSDNNGFLWVSSDKGLTLYNGKDFVNYTVKHGLPSNTVGRVVVSKKGRIYIICGYNDDGSNVIYYFENGKIRPYPYKGKLATPIEDLEFDENDDVSGALTPFKYFKKINGVFTRVENEKNKNTVLHNFNGRKVYLSIGNFKDPYYSLNGYRFKIKIPEEQYFLQNYRADRCFRKKSKTEIISVFNKLFIMKGDTGKIFKVIDLPSNVKRIFVDKQDNVWLMLSESGVIMLDENFFKTYKIPETIIKDFEIFGMTQDYLGGYWFTTTTDGVINIKNLNVRKYNLSKEFDGKQVTTIDKINDKQTLLEFNNEEIYIMTLENGEKKYKKIHPHQPVSKKIIKTDNDLYSIRIDPKFQEIQYTTFFKGYTYNLNTNRYTVKPRSNTDFYIIRHRMGIANPYYDELFKEIMSKIDLYKITPNYSYFDGDDYWILCEQEICRYNLKTHELFEYKIGVKATSIKKLRNNRLVISTLGKGFYEFKHNQFHHLEMKLNTNDEMVNKMTNYGNRIYASTLNGLLIVDLSRNKPEYAFIDKRTGYPIRLSQTLETIGTKILFSNNDFIGEFDVHKFPEKTNKPKLFLDSICVNSKKRLDAENFDVNQEDVLVFHMNSIDYSGVNGVSYFFKNTSEEGSSNWEKLANNELKLTDMQPQNYSLKLKVVNEAGVDSNIIELNYSVKSNFLHSKWFYFFLIILVAFVVVLYMLNRIKSIKEKNELREEALYYEVQALGAQMSPHFIFNVITNIQSFILAENKLKAFSYLNDFAKLMRISLDHIKEKWISLKSEMQLMTIFLKLENLRNENFEYEIEVDPNVSLENTFIPPLLIQPFVENAIKHGVFHLKDRKGKINIKLMKVGNQLQCEVSDNGYGREKAKTFTPTTSHKSHAHSITVKRLELIMKYTNQKFEFEIIDLPNEMGTVVKYNIPYKIS